MTLDEAKKLLIKRYEYLYQNAYFVLAPFMYEQSEVEYEKMKKENIEKYGSSLSKEPLIYLKIETLDNINKFFEEFLLSDKNLQNTNLYELVESNRNNKEYLEYVKKGLKLLDKDNEKRTYCKESLDIWRILNLTYDYIKEQSGDLKNKENKLSVLDEYYRIARYKNDGKIYTSGRNLNLHDCSSIVVFKDKREPFRNKKDIGIAKNPFITTIVNAPYYEDNYSIFTENEKQKIYLKYHDELPCDLEITCEYEESYVKSYIETRLHRPENTKYCGESFIINENEIFINPDDEVYRYYQICPNCGYMVNIPKEILSEGIKNRIEERCSKDDKLFRKMYLYSELFSLDKNSKEDQKKLLKK